ncbi:MAG: serine--tRNA ligase [Acidimicrobiia bacterium]|nr:serine--tRNA ligase [Acidimicrobiia bacterium]
MIDSAILRSDPDRIRESQRRRGEDVSIVDRLIEADKHSREARQRFDELRNEQKVLSKQIGPLQGQLKKAGDDAEPGLQSDVDTLMARAQDLADRVKAAEIDADEAAAAADVLWREVSNLVDPTSPVGGEEDFVVLEHVGTPRDFSTEGFAPKDHLELGEALGAIDVERGAKVSGSRFFYLTGPGAELEFALSDDLYLVGTSEVPLAALHSDEILEADDLPRRYAGWSSCFRREAGSHGKDTRGIIRVHQFDKVEMFVFCDPADAEAEHANLLAWEKQFLDALELPYRVIDVATGDLGASAAKKFDIEAWIPTQGAYREVTSTSNTTEYQARRLKIRMRKDGHTAPLATLNGTLCAMPRIIVALLENHQQADGSVSIPTALQPYLGGRSVL